MTDESPFQQAIKDKAPELMSSQEMEEMWKEELFPFQVIYEDENIAILLIQKK